MNENENHFEILKGQIRELPCRSVLACVVAGQIAGEMNRHLQTQCRGVVVAHTLFAIDVQSNTARRPSVAFVAYDRWPDSTIPNIDPWKVVPDLAIEVISPSSLASAIDEKIVDYFRCGVRLVWVVFPESARVHVYTSAIEVKIIERDGELSGDPVLPGFQVKVADLYRGLTKPTGA